MNIWFVRSNGETAHNNPYDSGYVPNEPPVFPLKDFIILKNASMMVLPDMDGQIQETAEKRIQ